MLPPHSSRVRSQSQSQVCPCGVSHVAFVSVPVYSGFSGFLPLSRNMPVGGLATQNCPLAENEGETMCAHDALRWTGVLSRVYSCLVPSVPRICSRSAVTQPMIRRLLKMNECIFVSHNTYSVLTVYG